jgi:branched-chain amino acid transport system permease protein
MGGSGKVAGALGGAVLLMVFLEGSRFIKDWIPGVSEVQRARVRLAARGLALILVTIYRPNGLFGGRSK